MSFGGRKQEEMISGINVTPLVDIVLVLLIVFMVTAKMVVAPAVPLDLPEATQGEEVQSLFVVALPADGSLVVDGETIDDADLGLKAREALAENPELRAVIQADGDVPHRRVISVLDRLKEAGLARIAFGTSWPDATPAPSQQRAEP